MPTDRAVRMIAAVALAAVCGCAVPRAGTPPPQPMEAPRAELGAEPEAGTPPSAGPVVAVLVDRTVEELAVPAPFERISIRQQRGEECFQSTDGFELRVETRDGTTLDFPFMSTYGRFQLHVVPALAGGEALLCLRTGTGRGSEVRTESLRLFRLKDGELKRVLQVPLGAWEFVEDGNPQNVYRESSWALADVDADGVAEVMVSPSNPQTWTSADCDVYRWSDARGFFVKKK